MSMVLDQRKIEASSSTTTGFGVKKFMKIGSTSETPKMILIDHMKHPRRAHPPKKLAYREIKGAATESTIHVVKISAEFSNILKVFLRRNSSAQNKKANSKTNEEKSNRKATHLMLKN